MTDAPERIWALMTPRGGLSISSDGLPLNANPEDAQVEYIRADLVPRGSSDWNEGSIIPGPPKVPRQ